MKSFVYLGLAILFEVFGSTMLKLSKGLTVLTPSIGVAIGFLVSFAFFGFALKKLELSTAYAIWSGLGTAATAGVGVLLFQEALGFLKIIALLLGSQHFFGQFAKPLLKGARFPSASATVWG
jgi:multidrug transporter EmrE-like cation transporter